MKTQKQAKKRFVVISVPVGAEYHWYVLDRRSEEVIRCPDEQAAHDVCRGANAANADCE